MAIYQNFIRELAKPILFTLGGSRLYKHFQAKAMIKNIDNRLVDEPETELLPLLVKETDTVIDIGANYMYYSVLLARLLPNGKVYAYEPLPFTFEVGQRVLRHYRISNVSLYNLGASNSDSQNHISAPLQWFGAPATGLAHIANRDNEIVRNNAIYPYPFKRHKKYLCKFVKLDTQLLDQLPANAPVTFVKIDVEGAELFALEGMAHLLSQFKPNILFEINESYAKGFGYSAHQIYSFLVSLGYDILLYNDREKTLSRVDSFNDEHNYIGLSPVYRERLAHLIV